MITAAQCRAARGLLGWSQLDLAESAGIAVITVHQFEAGASRPRRATVDVIRRAFESAGVRIIHLAITNVPAERAVLSRQLTVARPSPNSSSPVPSSSAVAFRRIAFSREPGLAGWTEWRYECCSCGRA